MTNESNCLTRKEREKLLRRNEILNAAARLFAEKGFINTTLDEIAEASEFGKGTLYNYFQNKDEIFSGILERIFEDYISVVQDCYDNTSTLRDFLTILTSRIFEYSILNKYSIQLMARVRIQVDEFGILLKSVKIKNIVDEIQKLQLLRTVQAIKNKEIIEVDPESLIALYRSMVFPYLHYLMQCKNDSNIDINKESDFLLNIFFNGILTK